MNIIYNLQIGWLFIFIPAFISYEYLYSYDESTEEVISFAMEGTGNDLTEKVDSLLVSVDESIKHGNIQAASGILEEVKELLITSFSRERMARAKAHHARILLAQGSYIEAIQFLGEAYQDYKDTSVQLSLGNLLATAYRYQGNYEDSLKRYIEMLEIAKKKEDLTFESAIEQNLAVVYEIIGDIPQALERYFNSLEIAESQADTMAMIAVFNNIGDLYGQMEEYQRAELYIYQSLELARKQNSKSDIYNAYTNLGVLYRNLGEFEKAMDFYKQSLAIAGELGNVTAPVQILFNMGNIYLDQGFYDQAESAFQESLEMSSELRIVQGKYFNNIGLGDVFWANGRHNEADTHYRRAFEVAVELGSASMEKSTLERLIRNYEKAEMYADAFKYQKRFQILSDSLQSLDKDQAIARYQTLFNLRQEQEQNELLQEKLKAQNNAMLSGIISSVILLVAAIVLIRMYRQQQRSIRRLSLQNDELEKLNRQVEFQKGELAELNETKDKLFSILAHDLRSPIAKLQSLLMLLQEDVLEEQDKDKAMEQIDRQLQLSITTFENYLNWAQSQMQGLEPDLKPVELYNKIIEVTDTLLMTAAEKNISFQNLVDNEIVVIADESLLRIVLRNILSNALKYSNKGDAITIDAEAAGKSLVISVQDTGVGIPENKHKRIFTAFDESLRGTDNERGTGLGLSITKEFVERQNGRIWFESTYGKGSIFYIELWNAKATSLEEDEEGVHSCLKVESDSG